MKLTCQLLGGLVFLSACLASIASLQPSRNGALKWRSRTSRVTQYVLAPDEEIEIKTKRMQAKERIVKSLLAGEQDLFEAAAWFLLLNEIPDSNPDHHWRKLPGGSVEEKHCRQVICWVRAVLRGTVSLSQVEARALELEEKLQSHIARNGKVQLPSR